MFPNRGYVLASASPRRRELLSRLIAEFEVDPADIDEDSLSVLDPWVTAKTLALEKAKSVAKRHPRKRIIGSDTVVAIETGEGEFEQLAKPQDANDAVRMLTRLSGELHFVITGVAILSPDQEQVEADTTKVQFRALSDLEIHSYVATGEPMDKAGAYAIQGGAAGFIERIEGSLTNVVGLPLEILEQMLKADSDAPHRA